ncbi:MAG TPA: TetR/AcrR family transcriptional regulator [Solirubrobacteraceae bacterium]|nr:TetR/AcrR family transcriptional regulator [Solirubrobacteraceae bacterium]
MLDATLLVIRERGLARTRTSHIARAAGCAEGTIYRYYSGKSELVRAALHSQLRTLIAVLADLPVRVGTATVEANLLGVAGAALTFYGEGLALIGCLLADTELLAGEREFIAAHDVGPHKVAANLAAYLKAEQKLGRLRQDADVEVAARLLLASCLGESVFRATDAAVDAADKDRYLRGLVGTVLGGLATPKPETSSAHVGSAPKE